MIHWNDQGIQEALRTARAKAAVEETLDALADRVRAQGILVEGVPGDVELPVETLTFEDETVRGLVTLSHPAGLAVQAKHGVLTKAAADLGLEIEG